MLEKTIEEVLKRYVSEVWPNDPLDYLESQRRLPNGKILDLCFRDSATNDIVVIELKRGRVAAPAASQLDGYLRELRIMEPESVFRGLLAGTSISRTAEEAARALGLGWTVLDERELENVARRHGLPVAHESQHRPRLSRSNTARSRPMNSASRPAALIETVTFLRSLDARFPPGSLTSQSSVTEIMEYWKLACPTGSEDNHSTAAYLTREVLMQIPSSAIANRSQSKSDPYTTIKALDGRVIAAIDVRARFVKLDFPLPHDLALKCVASHELRIWNPRGYSDWVQSRVGIGIAIERASQLLRIGLAFEVGT